MADKLRTPLDWDDLRYVLALARGKSLSATARALHVNHATVARRIDAVEVALGHLLFDRRADGYALTVAGTRVVEKAEEMEKSAMSVGDMLGSQDMPTGKVRITATRSFADLILTEALADIRHKTPGIAIELFTDVRVVSIAQRAADIALRFGRPQSSDLIGRKVGEYSFGYYAAPSLIEANPDISKMPLVGWDEDSSFAPEFQWMQEHLPEQDYVLRSNSNYAQAVAAASGLGVALLPDYLGRSLARLVPIEFGQLPPNREIWILTRPDLASVPRVRIVMDHLIEKLAQLSGQLVVR
jgi:DNA-binding transcriptional LysR family regulator